MFQRFRAGALGAAAFAITLLSAGQADAGGMAATAMLQASLPSGILAATEVSLPDVKRAELANTPRWLALADLTDPKTTAAPTQVTALPLADDEVKGHDSDSKPSSFSPGGTIYAPAEILGQGYQGEVEPNNTSATASPLTGTNLVVRASVYPNADVDFYSFSAMTQIPAVIPTGDRNYEIQIYDLHKAFGQLEVLKGITTTIHRGEVVCVIGPSGSGKSTLLRCVNLLELPTKGRIFILNDEITDPDADIDLLRTKMGRSAKNRYCGSSLSQ